MDAVNGFVVSPAHVAFAEELAKVAEKHGVTRFEIEYHPVFSGDAVRVSDVTGNARINYSAMDGRGRPCSNLVVIFDATIRRVIVSTPPSFS